MDTDAPLKIYAKRWWLLLLGDGVLLFGSIYVLLFPSPIFGSEVLERTLGIIGTLFFGCGFFLFIKLSSHPALLVDSDGIIDNSSGTSVGRIPWSNIQEVRAVNFLGRSYIGIIPVSLEVVMKACGPYTRWAMKRRINMGFPPVAIPSQLLGLDSTVLLEQINNWRTLK